MAAPSVAAALPACGACVLSQPRSATGHDATVRNRQSGRTMGCCIKSPSTLQVRTVAGKDVGLGVQVVLGEVDGRASFAEAGRDQLELPGERADVAGRE